MTLINALTVDLEYWWCNEYMRPYLDSEKRNHITEQVDALIKMLREHSTIATFFVLGQLAKDQPELIEKIFDNGHEIACHSFSHDSLTKMIPEEFRSQIEMSLQAIGKYRPKGFRAPNFSIDNDTRWALDILENYSFEYDSSIFPLKTPLYGVAKAPLGIYSPSKDNICHPTDENGIIEFPPSAIRMGRLGIPISGDFYLRALPYWLIKAGLKSINRIRPGMVYVHLQDLFPSEEKIGMPPFQAFQAYYGTKNGMLRLRNLLNEFEFCTAGEIIDEI